MCELMKKNTLSATSLAYQFITSSKSVRDESVPRDTRTYKNPHTFTK